MRRLFRGALAIVLDRDTRLCAVVCDFRIVEPFFIEALALFMTRPSVTSMQQGKRFAITWKFDVKIRS
jgi:hypothetical protein